MGKKVKMSESKDKFALILDSSQIEAAMICHQLQDYSYTQNLTIYEAPLKTAMHQGTYGHRMLDFYYKSRAAGEPLNIAIQKAYDYNPDDDKCFCGHLKEVHNIGVMALNPCDKCATIAKDCIGYKPIPSELPIKDRQIVKDRLRDYFFKWHSNDIIPDSPESVEVGFTHKLYEDDFVLYALEGRIDILGSLQGIPLITDHKFQTRVHNLYQKSIQFRNYSLAARRPTVLINYIRLHKAVIEDTLVREVVSFNPMEAAAWKIELKGIYDRLAAEKLNLINYGIPLPLNRAACKGQYGYPCEFTKLCEVSYNPDLVTMNKQLYKIKEAWKPW